MKNPRESLSVDPLLNAVLADHDWATWNYRIKEEALAAMGSRRRRERRLRVSASVGVVLVLIAAAAWWKSSSASTTASPSLLAQGATPAELPLISEDEMLALFPSGSCVVVEVNGGKELVFFDAHGAQDGFVWNRH